MLQHELLFASSLTPYRHHAGPCTDQSCRTHPRHKTPPKSFALIVSTEFGQASHSRFCLQVFKVKGALGFTGSLRAAPMQASKTDRISWGREGRALAAAGGQREADFVLPGWGARAPLNHCPTRLFIAFLQVPAGPWA